MKVHKIELYIIDTEEYGVKDYISELKSMDAIMYIHHAKTTDVGKWTDDHELNSPNATIDTYKKWVDNK